MIASSKKTELPDMQQHPRMVLSQECHIERTATLGGMMEADLVAENGLPRARRALNDKDAAAKKAAAQNRVQSRHPRRYALEDWPVGFFSRHVWRHPAAAAI